MTIAIITLFIVLVGIMIRSLLPMRIPIWVLMLSGALVVLITQQISLPSAYAAIDWNVIGYLFGVFLLGQALEESGYISHLSERFFKHAKHTDLLIAFILIVMGAGSALLMNDTLAIIGTPVLLHIARSNRLATKPILITLAFAITIGSVMSPVGNPQNLLIATQGKIHDPFITFFQHLFLPTLINLGLAFVWIRFYFRRSLNRVSLNIEKEPIQFQGLARLSKIGLSVLVLLIISKIVLEELNTQAFSISLSLIALIAAAPVALSRKRFLVLRNMDWGTLVFFISMFILMQSVWNTEIVQGILTRSHIMLTHIPTIFSVSVIFSQLISNVPLVALYLPVLMQKGAGTPQLLTLAAGSTIAGNFLLIGAASNIIIAQNAERRGDKAFGFWEFMLAGVPLGVVNVLVYMLFLA